MVEFQNVFTVVLAMAAMAGWGAHMGQSWAATEVTEVRHAAVIEGAKMKEAEVWFEALQVGRVARTYAWPRHGPVTEHCYCYWPTSPVLWAEPAPTAWPVIRGIKRRKRRRE